MRTMPLNVLARDISRHPPNSISSSIGHQDKAKSNISSTKRNGAPQATNNFHLSETEILSLINDGTPDPQDNGAEWRSLWLNPYTFITSSDEIMQQLTSSSQVIQGDATGAFPRKSRRGKQFFLVTVYKNYTHVELLSDRTAQEYVRAWTATVKFFSHRGHSISKVRIDNETSDDLKTSLTSQDISVETVPANDHRRNLAENVIRHWKNHFIAVLATAHPSFPLEQWDLLVPHSEVTFNTLRPFGPNRSLSAYEGIHGSPFDFDRFPLGILGALVTIHDGNRKSWGAHGQQGYFIGHDYDKYREFSVYLPSTDSIRHNDTIDWHPVGVLLPGSTGIEKLHIILDGLSTTLKAIHDKEIPKDDKAIFKLKYETAITNFDAAMKLYSPAVDTQTHIPNTAATGLYKAKTFHPTFIPVRERGQLGAEAGPNTPQTTVQPPPPHISDKPPASTERPTETRVSTSSQETATEPRVQLDAAHKEPTQPRVPNTQTQSEQRPDRIKRASAKVNDNFKAPRIKSTLPRQGSVTIVPPEEKTVWGTTGISDANGNCFFDSTRILNGQEHSEGHNIRTKVGQYMLNNFETVTPTGQTVRELLKSVAPKNKSPRAHVHDLMKDRTWIDAPTVVATAETLEQHIEIYGPTDTEHMYKLIARISPTDATKANASAIVTLVLSKEHYKPLLIRQNPPQAVPKGRYELLDDSYEDDITANEASLEIVAKEQDPFLNAPRKRTVSRNKSKSKKKAAKDDRLWQNKNDDEYREGHSTTRKTKAKAVIYIPKNVAASAPALEVKYEEHEEMNVNIKSANAPTQSKKLTRRALRRATSTNSKVHTFLQQYDNIAHALFAGMKWVASGKCVDFELSQLEGIEEPQVTATPEAPQLNIDPITGKPITFSSCMKGPDSAEWLNQLRVEWRRLIKETETTHPVMYKNIPLEKQKAGIMYFSPQVKEKIDDVTKALLRRVRGTIGGDKSTYTGPTMARVAAMQTFKLLMQTVVNEDAHFMTIDIKDFYIQHVLKEFEYMRVNRKQVPQDIIDEFNLEKYFVNDTIYFEVRKTMYGLPQAGRLAQEDLFAHLSKHGFFQCANTPCLFRHKDRDITFCTVVDDFGVKYKKKEDVDFLIKVLTIPDSSGKPHYQIKQNWEGSKYIGFTIKHDRTKREMVLSMPGYIQRLLSIYRPHLKTGAQSPYLYSPWHANKNKDERQRQTIDLSPALPDADIHEIQQICGAFQWYARAVDTTMLFASRVIATQQSKPTENTLALVNRLCEYALTYPNNELVFKACEDMCLHIKSDASYLSEARAGSIAGGFAFLGNKYRPNEINGIVDCVCTRIDVVVSSAAEAELAAVYLNAKMAVQLRNTLADLGYPQDATLIVCDNQCAVGIANDSITQNRMKAMDMRWNWVRDRVNQGQFKVEWRKGEYNLADYFTKSQPTERHLSAVPFLVRVPLSTSPYNNARTNRNVTFKLDKLEKLAKAA